MPNSDMDILTNKNRSSFEMAWRDLYRGATDHKRWWRFSVFMVRRSYWRTKLGLAWPAISFALFVTMLSWLWGYIFGKDLQTYLPHFGYGFACWMYLNGILAGGDQVFNSNAILIREFPLPFSFYAFAKMAREFSFFLVHISCVILIDLAFLHHLNAASLWALAGFVIYIIDGVLVALILGMLSTRFRDVSQIIPNMMRAIFFFTPVLWTAENRPRLGPIVHFNPLYHAIEVVRAPLSGHAPTVMNWMVMLGLTAVLFLCVSVFFKMGTRQLRVWL